MLDIESDEELEGTATTLISRAKNLEALINIILRGQQTLRHC